MVMWPTMTTVYTPNAPLTGCRRCAPRNACEPAVQSGVQIAAATFKGMQLLPVHHGD
jgi:hypothetical protein